MQNFTLWRKGTNWFLFAFLLLIGTLPSFGQDCPTVSDSDQEFCYLSTVTDLKGEAVSGTTLRWYRTATSSTPIPSDELLINGDYYAGNEAGTCNARPVVTVSVDNLGAPISDFGNFYEPCEYSEDDVTTVENLKELITPSDSSYDINVYSEEYGDEDSELADSFVLMEGASYYIGQNDPSSDCRYSSRIAIQYSPVDAFAPTAEANQQFCESEAPTIADLSATGTSSNTQAFRWYSTANSNPALDPSTPLVNNETYYVSQIVNRTNSPLPPCESTERAMVTVEILPSDAGPDNTDNVLCISEADSQLNNTTNARNFFLSLLSNNNDSDTENDVPTDGNFSDNSLAQIVDDYTDGTKVGTYQTTYTVTFDNGCTDMVDLAVRVEDDPYAGEDTEETVCISEFESFLPLQPAFIPIAQAAIADFIDGSDITPGGTFSPSITDLFTQINDDFENNNFPATYTVTYTVNNEGCVDSSELTLNVQSPNDAGSDNSATLCENEVDDRGIFASDESLRAYFVDLLGAEDDSGDFNPELSVLRANYSTVDAPSETFETEYTVTTSSECAPASATASLTVNASIPAEAGTGTITTYCSDDSTVDLTTLLTGANPNGVFSSDDADVADGSFAPSLGEGSYEITYTVSPETACVSNTDTAVFTITVENAPDAGSDDTASFCETDEDVMTAFADETSLEAYLLDLLGTDDNRGEFDPSLTTLITNYEDGIDGAEDFSTTYTIEATTACDEASATASITINEAVDAEAGTIEDITDVCSNDMPLTLADFLGSDSIAGGTFTSDEADVTDGTFDPSTSGAGEFDIRYTISEDDACVTDSDFADFTIFVDQAPNAGPGGDYVFCQAEFTAIAAQIAANPAGEGIELLNEFDPTITPDGDFTDNNLAQLLAQYAATASFPATFTTTYTVSNADCTDSADYTVIINPNEEANAGGNQTAAFCTTDGMVDLSGSIGSGATAGGTFMSDDLTLTGSTFDASAAGAGTFTVTYTVDETTDPCITGTETAEITVAVSEGFELGDDVSVIVCENDLEDDYFTEENLTAEFTALLPADAPEGTFNPEISDLVEDYTDGMTTGDFSTTYSIVDGACEDSVNLTITVRENIEAELDEVDDVTVCQNAGIQQLTDFIGNNPDFGVFEGYEEGTFDPAMMDEGTYDITYTLSEESSECVSGTASITFTISVIESALAGTDQELEVCNNDGVQDLYSFLSDNADNNGTFTLDGTEIAEGMMNPTDFSAGVYEVTYTVPAENDCGADTAIFKITVNESPDAGMDQEFSVCQNAEVQDLFSLLSEGVSAEGMFTIDGETITNGMMNPADFAPGSYAVIYTLSNENCTDTATFNITVQDSAFAGADMDLSLCTNDDVQDLYSLISASADMDGEFTLDGEVIADGIMDPSAFEAGTYEVTYTVTAGEDDECGGDDTATITVTLSEAPEAPTTGEAVAFCAIDGATAALLDAEGTNLTWYSDSELSMMVSEEDLLVNGEYYVTQSSDNGCESEAAMIMVNIVDSPAPTISSNYELCEYDNPTIADLTAEINESGEVTWYDSADSMTALSNNARLTDGTTYYATLISENGCESSQRLSVTVTLEQCRIIPEAITPNGDNRNDTFSIGFLENDYPNFNVTIFNRWGNAVYKGNASTPEWDGTANQSGSLGDDVLPVGVYFYVIDFNDGSTEPRQGKVYLNR